MLATYRRRHPKARVDMINRAYHMAAEAHRSQTRSSGESYINHPLAVATIVSLTPAQRAPAWQHSQGATWLTTLLTGLKPVLPDAIAQHLPA